MRKLFLTVLLALAAALAIIAFVEKSDGYVLVAVGSYTIEMSILLAALLLLVTYLAIALVFALLRSVFSAPANVSQWVGDQRQKQSVNRTSQGLVAYIEGRWDYASKSLERSAAGSRTPFVNYLFAAKASSELGDVKAVNHLLQKAEQVGDGADVAIGLTQAELQIQNRQFEQALATLLRVRRMSQSHPVGDELLAKVYVELGDWHNLLKLTQNLSDDSISLEERKSLQNLACLELINKVESDGDLSILQAEWKKLPSEARKRPDLLANYVQSLLRSGHGAEAEAIVRSQLQRNFSSEMAELYGMTEDEKPSRQLAFAEKLLKSYESDSSLLLTMGRLSQRNGDKDAAREYFEKSLQSQNSAAAFAELASIYASQEEFQKSSLLYQKAAILRGTNTAKLGLLQQSSLTQKQVARDSEQQQQ